MAIFRRVRLAPQFKRNPNVVDSVDYRQSDFQRLLYQLFIYEKKFNIADLADALGKKTDTIYAYCEGQLRLHVDDVRRIVRFVGDRDNRLVDYFCRPAGYTPMPDGILKNRKAVRELLEHAGEIVKKEEE